jgi:lysozyme family protein
MHAPLAVAAYDAAFETALAFTLRREGGYVNDPDDLGGATNYGITQSVYDAHRRRHAHVAAPVRSITLAEVREIYRRNYWEGARCSAFATVRPRLALAHFDAAVNLGIGQASVCLQRALGVKADGVAGPVTLAAAERCDESAVVSAYLRERARVYRVIAERRPALRKFLAGWLARCRWVARATDVPIDGAFTELRVSTGNTTI